MATFINTTMLQTSFTRLWLENGKWTQECQSSCTCPISWRICATISYLHATRTFFSIAWEIHKNSSRFGEVSWVEYLLKNLELHQGEVKRQFLRLFKYLRVFQDINIQMPGTDVLTEQSSAVRVLLDFFLRLRLSLESPSSTSNCRYGDPKFRVWHGYLYNEVQCCHACFKIDEYLLLTA